ncbi:MAG: cysteine--tRNA ligase, partial [Gammaproteobacteria bacterium]|nr:cysteine--tRNA ligase [Gammaproteobacteria bacterium]
MSKSLGNFFTVREVLARYPAEAVRYFMLTAQYRSPLNYTEQHLDQARAALVRLYTALRGAPTASAEPESEYLARFHAAMDDDLNTPEALAVLFDLARELNRSREEANPRAVVLAATLRHVGGVLGLLQQDPDAFLRELPTAEASAGLSSEQIETFITERTAARARKDWKEADRIRKALADQGVVLEDGAGGTTWRRG